MKFTCAHLADLRHALDAGHWPAASSPELRAHVASCPRCTQEVLLTTHLQHARLETIACSQPAPASIVWWRAMARRREAALNRAARPVLAAQAFALAVVLAAIGLIAARHWHTVLDHAFSAPGSISGIVALWGLTPLIIAAVLISTLGAVALYLTTDRH
ncbi:MAG TPA: hypothetical protein VHU44_00775 [Acidobacteriaceae bacterium]|jgi:hypothetical protein|nr:hypothetical protein [Acidobacteriaceae bacterium]